jgi:methionyl-tRNA formyltransferase
MKIVIYSSEFTSSVNVFNINNLLVNCPEHQYTIVLVKRVRNKISLWLKFKIFIVGLRDGKREWEKVNKKLNNLIRRRAEKVDLKNYPNFYVNAVNDAESEKLIKEINPDIILQAGAGILKKNIFSIARKGTINIHHGYAPEIRGMRSTFWCLYYGLTELIGVTCHFIDENLDTGDIIKQYKYRYNQGDTFEGIQLMLYLKGAELLVDSIKLLDRKQEYFFKTCKVESYYFSSVNKEMYASLKNNNFLPVAEDELSKLNNKVKLKRVLE